MALRISHQFIIIWLSLAAFLHNILMNGTNNVIISSLQKEFYLTSQETGVFVSVYDIGSLLSSVFVSYASARGSKPRWIAFGMTMLFIGSMVNVLPHFLKPHEPTANSNTDKADLNSTFVFNNDNLIELCNHSLSIDNLDRTKYFQRNFTSDVSSQPKNTPETSKSFFNFQLKHLLYAANVINGMSSASMTTITFSYIEDFAPARLSSIYESVYFAVGALGVGIGFMVTSKCLSYHTDIDRLSELPSWLKPTHPNWIGAWWLPYLIFGFASLIFAVVIFLFPRKLELETIENTEQNSNLNQENELLNLNSNNESTDKKHSNIEHDSKIKNYEHDNTFVETIKKAGSILSINNLGPLSNHNAEMDENQTTLAQINDEKEECEKRLTLIEKSLLLFRNPVYLFVIIAAAIEGLLQNSFLAFASLFLEYQYRLASGSASLILGLLSIPPLMIGGLLSGFIVNSFKNKTKSSFKFLAVILFVNIFVYVGFMVYCKEPTIITNNDYQINEKDAKFFSAQNCNCNNKMFKPICLNDSNDITYQSACLAGCFHYEKDSESYSNCTKIQNSYKLSDNSNNYFINGLCPKDSSCTIRLIISYLCIFLLMLLNALTFLPYLKVTIGCINAKEMNSIGLGMKQFFMNAFGTIPGPILFGSIIDSTCIYWHTDLNDQRVCKLYDNKRFAFGFGLLGVGFKTVCFFLIILSLIFLRKRKNQKT